MGGIKESLGLKKEVKPEENKVEDEKLGSVNLFDNYGVTLIIVAICMLAIIGVVYLSHHFVKKSQASPKWTESLTKAKRMVFYNPLIRYSFLNFIKLNMACFVACYAKGGTAFNTVLAVLLLLVLNLVPAYFCAHLYRNRTSLESKDSIATFGTLYSGLKLKSRSDLEDPTKFEQHKVWVYPLVFMLRKTVFVAITVLFSKSPSMQMTLHEVTTFLYTVYIIRPGVYECSRKRFVEVGSELLLLPSTLVLHWFLTVAPQDKFKQEVLTWTFFTVIFLLISLNMHAFIV